MYENALKQAGLTAEQAQIYEILLKTGPTTARKIAQASPIKRSLVYKILDDLGKLGLCTKKDEVGKVSVFGPAHPLKLKELAEAAEAKAKNAQAALENVLGALTSDFNMISGRPGVKFYEGVEGIKRMHQEILMENKEILAYVQINQEWDKPLQTFWDWYYKERVRRGIKVRSIAVDNKEGRAYQALDVAQLRQTRLVPADKFPIESEKNIYGNKVAYLNLKTGEQIAVMIDSPGAANTERAAFELAWQQAGQWNLPNATASAPKTPAP